MELFAPPCPQLNVGHSGCTRRPSKKTTILVTGASHYNLLQHWVGGAGGAATALLDVDVVVFFEEPGINYPSLPLHLIDQHGCSNTSALKVLDPVVKTNRVHGDLLPFLVITVVISCCWSLKKCCLHVDGSWLLDLQGCFIQARLQNSEQFLLVPSSKETGFGVIWTRAVHAQMSHHPAQDTRVTTSWSKGLLPHRWGGETSITRWS